VTADAGQNAQDQPGQQAQTSDEADAAVEQAPTAQDPDATATSTPLPVQSGDAQTTGQLTRPGSQNADGDIVLVPGETGFSLGTNTDTVQLDPTPMPLPGHKPLYPQGQLLTESAPEDLAFVDSEDDGDALDSETAAGLIDADGGGLPLRTVAMLLVLLAVCGFVVTKMQSGKAVGEEAEGGD